VKHFTARFTSVLVVLAFSTLVLMSAASPSLVRAEGLEAPAAAQTDNSGTPKDAGMQAASFLLTIPYGIAKSVFALSGGIVGGLTYAFTGGDTVAAKKVWHTSMYGTYVITPAHLRGEKPVRFLGVSDESQVAQDAAPTLEASPIASEQIR